MKKAILLMVATSYFTLAPLYAQQPNVSPPSKTAGSPNAAAGQVKAPEAVDSKKGENVEGKLEARKARREHRKSISHRQRRKH